MTENAKGLAAVEIPPHTISSSDVREKREYTQVRLHDNKESIAVTLLLTPEAVNELRGEL